MALSSKNLRRGATRSAGIWVPLVVVLLAVVAITFVVPNQSTEVDTCIRVAGLALQVFGLGMVAFGLNRTRSKLEERSLFQAICDWARNTFTPGKPHTRHVNLSPPTYRFSGSPGLTTKPVPSETTEQKVDRLQKDLERVSDRVVQMAKGFDSHAAWTKQALQDEAQSRNADKRDVTELLKDLSIGGLQIEWAGLIFLLFGIVFATVPGAVSDLLVR